MKSKRRNRIVEIYFVLYLAAIIFLLPDPKPDTKSDNSTFIIQNPFSLVPVKTSLTCRYFVDTTGVNIVSMDSVNVITFSGDVNSLDFEYQIEDLTYGQKQIFTGSSKYFKFVENLSRKELIFYWYPPLNELTTKTYLVKIKAKVKEKNVDVDSPEIQVETQFSLVISNISDERQNLLGEESSVFGSTQNLYQGIPLNQYMGQPITYFGADATLDVSTPEVVSRAYEKWENKVNIFGLSSTSDLAKKPEVKFFNEPDDNKGTAELGEIGKNFIQVVGRTPSHGKMKVKVITKFKSNNTTKEIDFYVTPLTIEKPRFESIMYPEKEYVIDSRLPLLKGQKTSVYLRDKEKNNIILNIEQGEPKVFKPDVTLIGKVLTLERLIDDIVFDKYDIRIKDYPDPIIDNFQNVSREEVKVVTRCWGFYNGEKNNVRLDIRGNGTVAYQPRGKIPVGEDELVNVQIFKVVPKSKDKPFNFEVKTIDLRGRESNWRSFTQ